MKYIELLQLSTHILPFSIIVLFFELSIIASFAFSDLDWEINKIGLMAEPHTIQEVRLKLDCWKQKHALVSQMVGQIDQCFGAILLIITANCFVASIIKSYRILKEAEKGDYLHLAEHSLSLLNFLIIMTMITSAPNKIRTEVS